MFDGPALADPTIVGNGDVRAVTYGGDHGLYVEFRMENVHQEYQSEIEGKPVYKQVPFIRIYRPGDKTTVNDRPVQLQGFADIPSDPQRFPQQWAAFQQGAKAVETGFPLAEWAVITAAQVREMNAINIYTLEQLSMVPDTALDGMGHGGRALRDKAVAHLKHMTDDSYTAKLVASNNDLQRQIDELRASMTQTDAPRRGRPPKSEGNDDAE